MERGRERPLPPRSQNGGTRRAWLQQASGSSNTGKCRGWIQGTGVSQLFAGGSSAEACPQSTPPSGHELGETGRGEGGEPRPAPAPPPSASGRRRGRRIPGRRLAEEVRPVPWSRRTPEPGTMGGSASSQLDESKCAYIRGKTEATVRNFSPFYRRQYAVAFCGHVCSQVEPHRDTPSQLLKTKPPLEPGTVLYEAELIQFSEDIKKWKERYVVVKNDFAVESYENKEAFQRGAAPRNRFLPAAGQVLTSEAEYNALSDQHFPDPVAGSEKDPPQTQAALPTAFPVFLWLPFVRPGSFCCVDAAQQQAFSALLRDCVRHLNQDYVKQRTFETQAFLEAVQFFQQEKSHYDSWEMNTGDEIQILSGLVMEELLPTLQADLLPRMKGKKQDRKRAWLGLLEEAYSMVGRQVSEGLDVLKEESRVQAKELEGAMRADADQIVASKNFLSGKIKATVAQRAEVIVAESVQPFLASLLEEIMGPVSSGFSAVRELFEREVDVLAQTFRASGDGAQLSEHLRQLERLPLDSVKMEPCYQHADLLLERSAELQSRFRFPHVHLVAQRAQSYMQELMGNAVFTLEQLLAPHLQGEAPKIAAAIEKVKLRVLKQYDYDSSSVRKRLCQGALVQVTLPVLRRSLAVACKPELQNYEQFIFADHSGMIHVDNVYEEVLHEMLSAEALKVIKEAASLKRHNLFDDGVALPSESVSSLTDLKTPMGSGQASPARVPSALLPSAPESEALSNEVFQESEDNQHSGSPTPVTGRESPSPPGSSPPPEQDGRGLVSSVGDPGVSSGTLVGAAGVSGTCSAVLEFGGTPEPQEPLHQKPEAMSAAGSLDELRDLLTVTLEIPVGSVPLEVDKDAGKGVLTPQESAEEEERAAPIHAVSAGSSLGDTRTAAAEALPDCREPPESAHSPDSTEGQAEAGEPAEGAAPAVAVGSEAQEVVGGAPLVPGEPGEAQGEPQGAQEPPPENEETKLACGGVSAPRVFECQWVVEGAQDPEFQGSQEEEPSPEPTQE